MGNNNINYSHRKANQIIDYYLFHKKIESIIEKGENPLFNKKNKNEILYIYIVNPNWLNNWKLYTNYDKIKIELDKIEEKNEEKLKTKLKEKCKNLINEGKIDNSQDNKPNLESHKNFGKIILELDFFKNEVFDYLIDYKTSISFFYDLSMFNYLTIDLKYIKGIINDKMIILMIEEKKKLKFIYKDEIEGKNDLIQLTASFSDSNNYTSFCNKLKKQNSEDIINNFNRQTIGYLEESNLDENKGVLKNENLNIKYFLEKNDLKDINFENITNSKFIGLNKIRSPPFLNAVIQNLININPLTTYLLNKSNYSIISNNKESCFFTCFYCQLLSKLCIKDEDNPYSLNDFDKYIYLKESKFKFYENCIPGDLIKFILVTLNMDYNQLYKKLKDKNPMNINNNIISKTFMSIQVTNTECENCKDIKKDYYNSFLLEFYLDIIYNTYINTENITKEEESGKNILKLQLCFKHFSEPLSLNSDSGYFCQTCKKKTNCKITKKYYYLPHFLIIAVNKDINNNDYILSFQEDLNLKEFINDQSKNENYEYKLRGIISHENKKYYSFCKHRISNKWYKCNDEDINCSEISEVLKQNPDVLIYESQNKKLEPPLNIEKQINSDNSQNFSDIPNNSNFQYNFGNINYMNYYNGATFNNFYNIYNNFNQMQNIYMNNMQNTYMFPNYMFPYNMYNTNIINNNMFNYTMLNNNMNNRSKTTGEMFNPNTLNKNEQNNNNVSNPIENNNEKKSSNNLIEGNINLENKGNKVSEEQSNLFKEMKKKMGVNIEENKINNEENRKIENDNKDNNDINVNNEINEELKEEERKD